MIKRLETAQDATSRCVWHPNGRTFICATATRDLQVISLEDGALQRVFTGGHNADINSISWSPNGALLASASGDDDQLVIWNCKDQQILKTFNYEKILHITWHNKGQNLFSWTNLEGETYIIPNFLRDESHLALLQGPKVKAPYFHDPLAESRPLTVNGARKRASTPDSLDDLLGPAPEDDYDWIEDDDNAGYTNGNGKRTNGHLEEPNGYHPKRPRNLTWQPRIHEPFQPGSTPWRGNRKYLCLNLVGFAWTVDQDTHHTVTVEFFDRDTYRDFHFTDPFRYDKACLNEHGTLFACPANDKGEGSTISYRPHETWTNRTDWRINLPNGEEVTSIALSSRYVVATTSKNYVRVWTLYGTPVKIWRMKGSPAVTCAAHGDYIMTVANGPVGADGSAQLVYSIENIRRDETCQDEASVALGFSDSEEGVSLKNIFWSDEGDPLHL